MKICLASLNLRRGGAEKIAILLAHELKQMGHEVRLVVVHGPVEYQNLLNAFHICADLLFCNRPYFWTNLLRYALKLRSFIRQWQPDVVTVFGGQILIIARLAGISPLVVSAQNSNGLHWRGNRPGYVILRTMEKWALRGKRVKVVGVSPSVGQAYEKQFSIASAEIPTIFNATEIEIFDSPVRELNNERLTILCVGTLYYQKNFHMAVRALRALMDHGVSAWLRIAGDGPDRQILLDLAKEIGVFENLILLGQRKDIPALMASADIFWITSRWEGFGLVVAEAMAASLPVVGTRVAGLTDVIEDGKTGVLVPLDDHQALAKATLELLRNPLRARQLAQNGHEKAMRDFHPRRMAEEYLQVFHEIRKENLE